MPPIFIVQPPGIQRFGSAGFTLLELTVVIALLAILTAMIIPEMRGSYADAVLRAGSRDLAGVCAIASSRAVSFNRLHRVLIEPGTGRYRLEKRNGRAADGESAFVPVRDVEGSEGKIDTRVRLSIHVSNGVADLPVGGDDSRESPGDGSGPGPAPDANAASALPAEVRVGSPQSVSFYPDGTADGVSIQLRDGDGFGLVLKVNPVTARIRVSELKHR